VIANGRPRYHPEQVLKAASHPLDFVQSRQALELGSAKHGPMQLSRPHWVTSPQHCAQAVVTPSLTKQSAVHLLPPPHIFAQVATLGSIWSLPMAQSVALTHAPACVPHESPPSPDGPPASSVSPPAAPAAPDAPLVPEPLVPLETPVDPDAPLDVLLELEEPPAPDPCPSSLLPAQARRVATRTTHQRSLTAFSLNIEMLLSLATVTAAPRRTLSS